MQIPSYTLPDFPAPQALSQIFSAKLTVLAASVDDYYAQLMREEQALLTRAVDKRRREFSTGRVLARAGLTEFDITAYPLLRGKHNEPLWPEGLRGSISHSSSWCVVVLGSTNDYRGIGVDVEHEDAKVGNLAGMILRPEERRPSENSVANAGLDFLRLSFSAKESVYKSVFYDVGRFIDFDEVRLDFSADGLSFRASAPDDPALSAMLDSGRGHCAFLNGHIVTSFVRDSGLSQQR